MTPEFVDGHDDTVPGLRQDVRALAAQLDAGAGAFLIMGRAIGTAETPIRHGLRSAPSTCFPITTLGVLTTVTETRAPDATFLYLKATAPVTVNLLVV